MKILFLLTILFAVLPLVATTPIKVLRISSWDSDDQNLIEALKCDGDAELTSLTHEEAQLLSEDDFLSYDVVFIAVSTCDSDMSSELADNLVKYYKKGGGLLTTGLFNFAFPSTRSTLKDIMPFTFDDYDNVKVCPIAGFGFGTATKVPIYMTIPDTQKNHDITRLMTYTGGSDPLSLSLSTQPLPEGVTQIARFVYREGDKYTTVCDTAVEDLEDSLFNSNGLLIRDDNGGRSAFLSFPLGSVELYVGSIQSFCTNEFFGKLLQNTIRWLAHGCTTQPCANGGLCKDKDTCMCSSDIYTGDLCESPLCSYCVEGFGTCKFTDETNTATMCYCNGDPNALSNRGCKYCKDGTERPEGANCPTSSDAAIDPTDFTLTEQENCSFDSGKLTATGSNTCEITSNNLLSITGPSTMKIRMFLFKPELDSASGTITISFIPKESSESTKTLTPIELSSNNYYTELDDSIVSGDYKLKITLKNTSGTGKASVTIDNKSYQEKYCESYCQNDGKCTFETPEFGKELSLYCNCEDTDGFEGLDCGTPTCGDSKVRGNEACDSVLGCDDTTCQAKYGYVCDATTNTCTRQCGDGMQDETEACDDGNTIDGDGCSKNCEIEPYWECDPTYKNDPTHPDSVCKPKCGDGFIYKGFEECDGGENPAESVKLGCIDCKIAKGYVCVNNEAGTTISCSAACGNGVVGIDEKCDDGNTSDGDGCSSSCIIEEGYACESSVITLNNFKSICSPICGDGKITGTEDCDDKNTKAGDGCSSDCKFELGYTCSGVPSVCTRDVCTVTLDGSGYEVTQPKCKGSDSLSYGTIKIKVSEVIPTGKVVRYILYKDGSKYKDSTFNMITDLEPGDYKFVVQNEAYPSFCSVEGKDTIQIVEVNSDFNVTAEPITASNCGTKDGKIVVKIIGGNGPYKVNLGATKKDMTGTEETFTDIIPGSYRVTVTDANGCTAMTTSTIVVSYPDKCTESEFENLWARGGTKGVIVAAAGLCLVIIAVLIGGCYKKHKMVTTKDKFCEKIQTVPDTDLRTEYNIHGGRKRE